MISCNRVTDANDSVTRVSPILEKPNLAVMTLALEPATAESVKPFGTLIGAAAASGRSTAFYDRSVTIYDPPPFHSDDDTCLAIARIEPRDCKVVYLERHFKHTQVFLPLNGQPYVVVLAPPTSGPLPNVAEARAFRFAGDCGLLMNIGTWHEFPFALSEAGRHDRDFAQ